MWTNLPKKLSSVQNSFLRVFCVPLWVPLFWFYIIIVKYYLSCHLVLLFNEVKQYRVSQEERVQEEVARRYQMVSSTKTTQETTALQKMDKTFLVNL